MNTPFTPKFTRSLLALCCSLGWGAQLASAQSSMDSNSSSGATSNAPAAASKMGANLPASKPTDAQIMKIIQAVNDNEIEAAKMAEKQASSRDVKSFARDMEKEHTRMNRDGDMLGKKLKMSPEESAMSAEIKTMGKTEAEQLKTANRENFYKTYIDLQAAGHEKVLGIFDSSLLPNVKNPELKANLEAARKHVAEHMVHAQKVQSALSKSASAK